MVMLGEGRKWFTPQRGGIGCWDWNAKGFAGLRGSQACLPFSLSSMRPHSLLLQKSFLGPRSWEWWGQCSWPGVNGIRITFTGDPVKASLPHSIWSSGEDSDWLAESVAEPVTGSKVWSCDRSLIALFTLLHSHRNNYLGQIAFKETQLYEF